MSGDAARYQRIKSLFIELQRMEETARRERLRELSLAAPDVAAEVLAMLSGVGVPTPHGPALPPGYSHGHQIGLGGMGVVFRAERQVDGVRQTVAVKLLRHAALATPGDRARFDAERRILARLDHPHIARLLDAGTDADGRAWFAMEFVDGERIDHYCRRHALGLRERVQLFVQVCRAVDAAHRQLVVHRDLKPSNVLIDRHGAPKLLDFGIARLQDVEDADAVATGTGDTLLTLRYAAPEQLQRDPATPATDVYSLGVMLFELLCDESPYGDTASQPYALPELIRSADAPLPSAMAKTPWARALRGDLDAIVQRALRKLPAARYAGADRLADDLLAWLERRPVDARRGSRGYRVARFAGRHRVALAAAAVFVLLTALFVWRLERELARSERERLRAEAAVARSQATATFLSGLFKDAHPDQAKGASFTLREALDRGVERLQTDMEAAPVERATLLLAAADIYSELAQGKPAVAAARRSLEAARLVGDAALERRARLALSWALEVAGKLDEAEQEALAVQTEARNAGDEQAAFDALVRLGNLRAETDKGKALGLYDQIDRALLRRFGVTDIARIALAPVEENTRSDLEAFARNRHNRCAALSQLGRAPEARAVCEEARELKLRLWPADHPIHLTTLITLAAVAGDLGDVALALRSDAELGALAERLYGAEHPKTGVLLLNWAVDLSASGRDDEAEPILDRAIAVFEAHGPRRGYLMGRNNRANLLRRQGRLAESLAEHQAVATLRREAFGEDHAEVAQSDMNVANVLAELGRTQDALPIAARALATYERVLGPASPDTRRARMNLANKYYALDRFEESAAQAEMALRDAVSDPARPQDRGLYQFALAQPLWQLGRERERALQLARDALANLEAVPQYRTDAGSVREWLATRPATPAH